MNAMALGRPGRRRGSLGTGSALMLVTALLLAACSGRNDEDAEPEPAPEGIPEDQSTFLGEIYQTSSPVGTITMLSLEDRTAAVRLTGDLEEELRRLSGAQVEVEGERVQAYPDQGLRVERYEILRIDGARPHVGIVEVDGPDEIWLMKDDERLRVRGAPGSLGDRAGAKIWVVGDRDGGEVRLGSYGLIRP